MEVEDITVDLKDLSSYPVGSWAFFLCSTSWWVWSTYLSFPHSEYHWLISAAAILKFLGALRIEPRAAGWEVQNLPLCWAAPILFLYSVLSKKTILSWNLSQSTRKEHLGPTQSLPDTVAVVLAGQVLVGRADSGEVEGGEAARELRGVLETTGRLPENNNNNKTAVVPDPTPTRFFKIRNRFDEPSSH